MRTARSQKGSINPIAITLVLLVVLGGVGFAYFSKNKSASQPNSSTNSPDSSLEVNANDFYVFYYPKQFIKNEVPKNENSLSTYVYSYSPAKEADLKDGVGIKMFITPNTKHLPASSLDTCNNLTKSILNNSDVVKIDKVIVADGETAYGCDVWLSNKTTDGTDTLVNHMKLQWYKVKEDNSLLMSQGSYFESTSSEVKANIDLAVEKFYLK